MQINDEFNIAPFNDEWFSWEAIENCFWPGRGKRSSDIDPVLSEVEDKSGVYLLLWGEPNTKTPSPKDKNIKYIGQTVNFRKRMKQFAISAGITYEDRYNGHSAGWRWPKGHWGKLYVGFFPIESDMEKHMISGYLHWTEALALDMYYQEYDGLPQVNKSKDPVVF